MQPRNEDEKGKKDKTWRDVSQSDVETAIRLPAEFASCTRTLLCQNHNPGRDNYMFLFKLSRGSGPEWVLKAVVFDQANNSVLIRLLREYNVGRMVSHITPRAVKMLYMSQIPVSGGGVMVELLMEYGGEDAASPKFALRPGSTVDIGYQLVCVLATLEEFGVSVMDIKPKNIVLSGTIDQPFVKLIDFGTSLAFYMEPERIREAIGEELDRIGGVTKEFAPWEALPSAIDDPERGKNVIPQKVDVFCFAMCFLTMLCRELHPERFQLPPRQDHGLLVAWVTNFLTVDAKMTQGWIDMVVRCLSENPKERPTFAELKQECETLLEEGHEDVMMREIDQIASIDHYAALKECDRDESPVATKWHCEQLIKQAKSSTQAAEAHYYLGKACFHLDEYGKVVEHLGAFVTLQETLHCGPLFLLPKVYNALGSACGRLNKYIEAKEYITKAQKIAIADPLYAKDRRNLIYINFSLATMSYISCDLISAEKYIEETAGIIKSCFGENHESLISLYYEVGRLFMTTAPSLVAKFFDSALKIINNRYKVASLEKAVMYCEMNPSDIFHIGSPSANRTAVDINTMLKTVLLDVNNDTTMSTSAKIARAAHTFSYFENYNIAFGDFAEIAGASTGSSTHPKESFNDMDSDVMTKPAVYAYARVASAYSMCGDTRSASYYYDETMKCIYRTRGDDDSLLPAEEIKISDMLMVMKKYKQAERRLERALKKAKKTYSESDIVITTLLLQLNNVYAALCKRDKAKICMDELDQISCKSGIPNPVSYIEICKNRMGPGIDKQAMKMVKGGPHKESPLLISLYKNLVKPYMLAGDLRKGQEYINEALIIAVLNDCPRASEDIIDLYVSMGGTYDRLGKGKEAITWYSSAAKFYESVSPPKCNFANFATRMDKLRSSAGFSRTEVDRLSALPKRSPEEDYDLATHLFSLGEYKYATVYFHAYIDATTERGERLANAYYKLGSAHSTIYEDKKALDCFYEAVNVLMEMDEESAEVKKKLTEVYRAIGELLAGSNPKEARVYRHLARDRLNVIPRSSYDTTLSCCIF